MIISENGFGQEGDACVVCGIPLERLAIVEYQDQGKRRTIFCSNACLKEFIENPEKYRENDEEDAEE